MFTFLEKGTVGKHLKQQVKIIPLTNPKRTEDILIWEDQKQIKQENS